MAAPVVHFEISGMDSEKLQSFYENMFGWKIRKDKLGESAFIEAEGSGIGGEINKSEIDQAKSVKIYIQVDDLQKSLKKVEELGGKVYSGIKEVPGINYAMFEDPEGNIIGLVEGSKNE